MNQMNSHLSLKKNKKNQVSIGKQVNISNNPFMQNFPASTFTQF